MLLTTFLDTYSSKTTPTTNQRAKRLTTLQKDEKWKIQPGESKERKRIHKEAMKSKEKQHKHRKPGKAEKQ